MKNNNYAWCVVIMLWMIYVLNCADRESIGVVFPTLEKNFSFTKFQLGLIGASFMWFYASFSIVGGYAGDHFSRKNLIVGSCFFWSLMTLFLGKATAVWQFMLLRGLAGFGESFYFPAATSLLSDYHHESRTRALSLHQSGVYLGMILGNWLGGWIVQYYGWKCEFAFFGSWGVFVSVIAFFFLKEPQRERSKDVILKKDSSYHFWASCSIVWKNPIIALIILTYSAANAVTAVFTWMPLFLYEKFHLTLSTAGFFAAVFIQFASASSIFFIGWLSDEIRKRILGGRLFIQMVCLFSGAVAIIVIGQATNFVFLVIAMILFGMCRGGYYGGFVASLFDYVDPESRSLVVGIMNTIGWFGSALGVMLVGFFSTAQKHFAIDRIGKTISWSACFYFLGAGMLMVAFLKNKKLNSNDSFTLRNKISHS